MITAFNSAIWNELSLSATQLTITVFECDWSTLMDYAT